ncbi:hypothetical protein B9K04_13855, partial [Acetobacter syzygii]
MVEETTAASHNLTAETRTLAETLSRFKMDRGRASRPALSAPRAPARPRPARVAAPAAPAALTPPTLSIPTSSSDAGWEEF